MLNGSLAVQWCIMLSIREHKQRITWPNDYLNGCSLKTLAPRCSHVRTRRKRRQQSYSQFTCASVRCASGIRPLASCSIACGGAFVATS